MTFHNLLKHPHTPKLTAGALALFLMGGGVGALLTRPSSPPVSSAPAPASAPLVLPVQTPVAQPLPPTEGTVQIQGQTYRLVPEGAPAATPVQPVQTAVDDNPPVRQVRQNGNRRPARAQANSQRAYYNYDNAPAARRQQSWWQRNGRDVVTIAAGTGLGAGVGAIAGGKRGAGAGALAGGGGTALYIYGLRPRN
ncbi:hypothetical protein [Chloracidobacterium thermophilum]|uniref:hypothetical protein n=1 Tax=Chloracidobacterium thermophilum TaxID=458033 RepID=UPI0007388F6F|nr:hypothetical protein [Chloracidobacterium thermophilum]